MTPEQFEDGFKHDANPEKEVRLWEIFADSMDDAKPFCIVPEDTNPIELRKSMLRVLLDISSGEYSDHEIEQSKFIQLLLHFYIKNSEKHDA